MIAEGASCTTHGINEGIALYYDTRVPFTTYPAFPIKNLGQAGPNPQSLSGDTSHSPVHDDWMIIKPTMVNQGENNSRVVVDVYEAYTDPFTGESHDASIQVWRTGGKATHIHAGLPPRIDRSVIDWVESMNQNPDPAVSSRGSVDFLNHLKKQLPLMFVTDGGCVLDNILEMNEYGLYMDPRIGDPENNNGTWQGRWPTPVRQEASEGTLSTEVVIGSLPTRQQIVPSMERFNPESSYLILGVNFAYPTHTELYRALIREANRRNLNQQTVRHFISPYVRYGRIKFESL